MTEKEAKEIAGKVGGKVSFFHATNKEVMVHIKTDCPEKVFNMVRERFNVIHSSMMIENNHLFASLTIGINSL